MGAPPFRVGRSFKATGSAGGFFTFRGLQNVAAEWDLICLTHNLLKLYQADGSRFKQKQLNLRLMAFVISVNPNYSMIILRGFDKKV